MGWDVVESGAGVWVSEVEDGGEYDSADMLDYMAGLGEGDRVSIQLEGGEVLFANGGVDPDWFYDFEDWQDAVDEQYAAQYGPGGDG